MMNKWNERETERMWRKKGKKKGGEGQHNSKDLVFQGNHPSKEENKGLRKSGQAGR